MNYLAHLVLAGSNPATQIGGLIADFSRPASEGEYPPGIRAGIRLHRAIDHYTDQHPLVRECRALVTPRYRRVAGILVDVFFDHLLASNWDHHHPQATLEDYSAQVSVMLREQQAGLPGAMREIVARMSENDWLTRYRDADHVSRVIDRTAQRLSRPELLTGGGSELAICRDALALKFEQFFPQVRLFAAQRLGEAVIAT